MSNQEDKVRPFGNYEEEVIVSLLVDHPEFFTSISRYMTTDLFSRIEVQYVIAHITEYYDKHGVYPTRGMLLDNIKKSLTVDNIGYEEIIKIAQRKSDPREVPAVKDNLLNWARSKAYGLIYSPETIAKYSNGDYEELDKILNVARNIQDVGDKTMWFFEDLEKMFVQESLDHFTTGFSRLDKYLNDGGPCRKEVMVWMAPTGVGKSIALINNAIANVMRKRNVLYITFELSDVMSAVRALGVLTGKPIKRRFDLKDEMMSIAKHLYDSGDVGDLAIHEMPPDEVSVDNIYALIDHFKRSIGWTPDVVIIDYLELMISRRQSDNKDEYMKQKGISTQVRGLAINENVCVFTATQTNRSGNDATLIDVTKMAESYGKSMPIDYLISINQTQEEYNVQFDATGQHTVAPASARMYIAKNRNGPKFQSIPIEINYNNMKMEEMS